MANGTIAFDTLSTSGQITGTAKSVDTDYVVNGSVKAWFDINSVGTALDDSFNISSLDDDAVGDRGLNYTNSFSTVHAAISLGNEDNTSGGVISSDITTGSRTTGGFGIEAYYTSSNARVLYDTSSSGTVNGDLA
jgi:hypothetical protein